MNAETDATGRDLALAKWTGYSVRYLRVRRAVRALVCIVPLGSAIVHYLHTTP